MRSMKKIMLILSLCMLFSLLFSMAIPAHAESLSGSEETPAYGYSLDGYLAEIGYASYSLSGGGVRRCVIVTFDRSFYFDGEDLTGFAELPSFADDLLNYGKPLLIQSLKAYLEQIGYTVEHDAHGRVIGSMDYDSVTDLYIAYGIDGYENESSSSSEYDEKKSFFFVDSTSTQTSMFSDIETNENSIFYQLLSFLYTQGITRNEVSLIYQYGTPYKIVKSNADESFYDAASGIYIHNFYMNLDSAGSKIVLSQHSPNALGWYILAVGIAFLVAFVFVIKAIMSGKKQKTVYGG